MLASELVKRLQERIAEHGDLPVFVKEPDMYGDTNDTEVKVVSHSEMHRWLTANDPRWPKESSEYIGAFLLSDH